MKVAGRLPLFALASALAILVTSPAFAEPPEQEVAVGYDWLHQPDRNFPFDWSAFWTPIFQPGGGVSVRLSRRVAARFGVEVPIVKEGNNFFLDTRPVGFYRAARMTFGLAFSNRR